MKEMQKQTQPKAKEEKGPLISVKLGAKAGEGGPTGSGSGKGFKKGGFKNAFVGLGDDDDAEGTKAEKKDVVMKTVGQDDDDSDFTDYEEEYYDPRRPTDCTPGCRGKVVGIMS